MSLAAINYERESERETYKLSQCPVGKLESKNIPCPCGMLFIIF